MPASQLVRRHPDAIWLSTAAVVGGAGLLISGAKPGSFNELLPLWGVRVWATTLLLGGAFILLGIIQRRALPAAVFERIGRITLAWAAIVYAVAIINLAGWSGIASAAFIGFYGVGCAKRAHDLKRVLPGTRSWRHPFRVDSQTVDSS